MTWMNFSAPTGKVELELEFQPRPECGLTTPMLLPHPGGLRTRGRNWNRPRSPPSAISRFRACWATHSPTGCDVTPSTWTRRVAASITNRTYSRFRKTVSTVKKSTANTPLAWARRNCRQLMADRVGAASTPAQCRMAHMVLAPSLHPSRHSSPWMRRYPRSGSPWPAAAPARGAPPPPSGGHAGVDGSSGAGPGHDASPAGSLAARAAGARLGEAAAAPARPAAHGLPSRAAAGSPGVATPRPRGATRAARRPWQPNSSPAGKPPYHLAEQQIEQSKGHAPIIAARWVPRRTPRSAPTTEFLAPTGLPDELAAQHA
jgi:hypothetical protein